MELSDRIKTARMDAGLGQEELAAMLGVSRSTVNRWENEHHEPSQMARKVLKHLLAIEI